MHSKLQSAPHSQAVNQPSDLSLSVQSTVDKEINKSSVNATTQAILGLENNPFYHDKRKWEDSFTVAEIKELSGNIVKAAKDNDGETYVTLQEECTVPELLHEDESSQESDHLDSSTKKPGRKPIPDEESFSDTDQDPKVKRKAQNRVAQRAFRERKERYVKELENRLKQVQEAHLITTSQLIQENQRLQATVFRLESENCALKGLPAPCPLPYPLSSKCSDSKASYLAIAPSLPSTLNQMPLVCSNETASPVSSPDTATSMFQTLPKMTCRKPTSKKQQKQEKILLPAPPNHTPLEYTFSICTPVSLRPSKPAVSSSSKEVEPIEPIQLYPPSITPRAKHTSLRPVLLSTDKEASDLPAIEGESSQTAVSSVATLDSTNTLMPESSDVSPTAELPRNKSSKNLVTDGLQKQQMQQLELDMFDCHIESEKLYQKSSIPIEALNSLLFEPLFDRTGTLNLSLAKASDSTARDPVVCSKERMDDELNNNESSSLEQEK
ncbi:hypothetical protein BD560DRAFT_404153 [Blakeslea trispora]|nr:hypothetical protein BD560DRAFT_404153 [Blakeslea trispora]